MAPAFFTEPRAATPPSPLRRNEICASCFATSLPQDLSAQLIFDLGEIPTARLKPFVWFGILRRPVRRFARRVGSDAAQVPGGTQDFRAHWARCQNAAQALQVSRFFVSSARCADANCLRFAATRLKFPHGVAISR
jgi:hypothetical protein